MYSTIILFICKICKFIKYLMRIMYKEQPKIGGGVLTSLKIIFQKFGGAGAPPSLQVGNPMLQQQ